TELVATVLDRALLARGLTFAADEGMVFDGVVAGFTDRAGVEAAANYRVAIDWGDGAPVDTTTGTIRQQSGNDFAVYGRHAYASKGSYRVKVAVQDTALNAAAPAIAASRAAVRAAPPASAHPFDALLAGDAFPPVAGSGVGVASVWPRSAGAIVPMQFDGSTLGAPLGPGELPRGPSGGCCGGSGGCCGELRGEPAPIDTQEGRLIPSERVLATFTDTVHHSPGDYTVTIIWDDRTESGGSVSEDEGHYSVHGRGDYK